MKNHDDRSYKRYKQYRLNKYRYEQEQIIFPLAIILGLAFFLKYIIIAVLSIAIFAVIMFVMYIFLTKKHRRKRKK